MSEDTNDIPEEVISAMLLGLSLIESSMKGDTLQLELALSEFGIVETISSLAAIGGALVRVVSVESDNCDEDEDIEKTIAYLRNIFLQA